MFAFTTIPVAPLESAKPTIVLVHGAFANASSWNGVVTQLQKDGYTVVAVQNAMANYADDIATTKRILDKVKGSIVLVGHSYGGAVISGAATGNTNVKALVFISAFAPDEGETLTTLQQPYAATPLGTALQPDSAGFLFIDTVKFRSVFCADVPEPMADVMAVTQGPAHGSLFATPFPTPSWRTIPSWYMVSKKDQAINPDLERFCAKRMGAKTIEVDGSHCAFVAKPKVAADLIEEAAKSVAK